MWQQWFIPNAKTRADRKMALSKRSSYQIRLLQAIGILFAAPFLVGTFGFAVRLANVYSRTGYLSISILQYLSAGLLTFGLALGILGSTFALTSRSFCARMLWTALTLFGLSHVILGLVTRRAFENAVISHTSSATIFLLPAGLWACSVWLAVKAHSADKVELQSIETQLTNEEQPLPLSQP